MWGMGDVNQEKKVLYTIKKMKKCGGRGRGNI